MSLTFELVHISLLLDGVTGVSRLELSRRVERPRFTSAGLAVLCESLKKMSSTRKCTRRKTMIFPHSIAV